MDLAVLALLAHALGIEPRVAGPLALTVGVVVQFLGSKLFTFDDRSRAWGAQAGAFLLVEALAFALNLVGFDALVAGAHWPPILARIAVSMAVYGCVSWPLWSLIFRDAGPSRRALALGGDR